MSPYKSFWMGGFEGADHINGNRDRLDMVRDSGHELHVTEDYSRLSAMGIKTIRESIGWRISQPHKDSQLDLTRALHFANCAKRKGMQIIWTFMHYGTPEGIDLHDDSFIDHFTDYAVKIATALKPFCDAPIYNLINEISFLAWAVSQTNFIHPYIGDGNSHVGYQVKRRLVRAVLKAMGEIKKISPNARFIHIEPIIHMVAPVGRPDMEDYAKQVCGYQWQTFDLICGAMEPELGGSREALDLIGVNYYYNGQLEVDGDPLDWETKDPRRIPFSWMLTEASERYDKPLLISETGHFDEGRGPWLDEVLSEIHDAMDDGIPILGVCLYPVLDRPCWHEPHKIIRAGLLEITDDGRRYHFGSAKSIRRSQQRLQGKS